MRDLVVGFDLDMTLVDSADLITASLLHAAAAHGARIGADEARAMVGWPLDTIFGEWLPADEVAAAAATYRAHYGEHGIPGTRALPGAEAALQTVADLGGRSLVVSAKQTPQALAALHAAGLHADHVVGGVFGEQKAPALIEHAAAVYVGDHSGDMRAAARAGAVGVGVASNVDGPEQLRQAGAAVVLAGIQDAARWLRDWVLDQRAEALHRELTRYGSVVVAFSGGADSALVLAAATRALGPAAVRAVTAVSPSLAAGEVEHAAEVAYGLGVAHDTVATLEMSVAGYRANSTMRCAYCKAELLDRLQDYRARHGFAEIATGTNADDVRSPHRPGIGAAAQRAARTPLAEVGLTKQQVRELSAAWGLPTHDRPAKACLASRIRYGLEVTPQRLARVDRAEAAVREALRDAGLHTRDLRVRDHGDRATVEVDAALVTAAAGLPQLAAAVLAAGFGAVEVDPRGFRSGAMNEVGRTG